jgi:GntR family transcriptional repressor for pyruvate dehydrogenase complex
MIARQCNTLAMGSRRGCVSETPAQYPDPSRPRNGRAPDAVLDWLELQLETGGLRAGDRLPAERELAAQLNVSRRWSARIRSEALGTLTQGPARARRRHHPRRLLGRAHALPRLHVLLASIGTDDAVRARIALERNDAVAAMRATPADLLAMAGHLAEMERPAQPR